MVTIYNQPSIHYELVMKVLKTGKHVLVEKPFCGTVEEVREAFDYAKENKMIAMPYQNRQFDSEIIAVKEIAASGEFYSLRILLLDKAISLFGLLEKVFYDIRTLRDPENLDNTFEMQLFYFDKR